MELSVVGDLEARYTSHSHLQARYSSHSLFSHPPPDFPYSVLTVAKGDIGGNDLQRQGQRHSPNASASGTIQQAGYRNGIAWMVFGFLTSLYSWVSHSLAYYLSSQCTCSALENWLFYDANLPILLCCSPTKTKNRPWHFYSSMIHEYNTPLFILKNLSSFLKGTSHVGLMN